jgi:predicted Zn finger-like uncharacterized protein
MNVSCPECRSIFRIDPAKVPTTGVRARCSVCGGILAIGGGSLPVSVTPFSGVPRILGTPASVPVVPSPGTVPVPRLTPTIAVPHVAVAPPPSANAEPLVVPPQPAPMPAPVPLPVPAPAPSLAPLPVPAPAPSLAPLPVPEPTSAPAPLTAAEARRPINPFLQVDPVQRARRLARALVSDLVAYHPQKREEGLRDGTLRQLFREDIKKSYEEYVEQVGQEIAEQAPHFQEALNDILAGGRRLF